MGCQQVSMYSGFNAHLTKHSMLQQYLLQSQHQTAFSYFAPVRFLHRSLHFPELAAVPATCFSNLLHL